MGDAALAECANPNCTEWCEKHSDYMRECEKGSGVYRCRRCASYLTRYKKEHPCDKTVKVGRPPCGYMRIEAAREEAARKCEKKKEEEERMHQKALAMLREKREMQKKRRQRQAELEQIEEGKYEDSLKYAMGIDAGVAADTCVVDELLEARGDAKEMGGQPSSEDTIEPEPQAADVEKPRLLERLAEMEKEKEAREKQIVILQEQLTTLEKCRRRRSLDAGTLSAELRTMDEGLTALAAENAELRTSLARERQRAMREQRRAERAEAKDEAQEAEDEALFRAEVTKMIDESDQKVEVQQMILAAEMHELESAAAEMAEMEEQLAEMTEREEAAASKAKLLQEKLEVAEAGKAAAEADKAAFEARIFKKFHPLTQQITHLNAELEAKTAETVDLRAQLNAHRTLSKRPPMASMPPKGGYQCVPAQDGKENAF